MINKQYTAFLFDGSLIQISYTFKNQEITHHRLCYYPCPVTVEPDEFAEFGIKDTIESYSPSDLIRLIRLESPLRFEYDLAAASEDHPATHLHLSRDTCRIPVFAPISIGHFIRFIFRHFYPEQYAAHSFLRGFCGTNKASMTPVNLEAIEFDHRATSEGKAE